jgi:hypothetical protein
MDLQKLYDKVFEKAQKFGQLSPYSLSCEELMGLIRIAQSAQRGEQGTGGNVREKELHEYNESDQHLVLSKNRRR